MKYGFRSAFLISDAVPVAVMSVLATQPDSKEVTGNGQPWLRLSLHLDCTEELRGMWEMGSVERSMEM